MVKTLSISQTLVQKSGAENASGPRKSSLLSLNQQAHSLDTSLATSSGTLSSTLGTWPELSLPAER